MEEKKEDKKKKESLFMQLLTVGVFLYIAYQGIKIMLM